MSESLAISIRLTKAGPQVFETRRDDDGRTTTRRIKSMARFKIYWKAAPGDTDSTRFLLTFDGEQVAEIARKTPDPDEYAYEHTVPSDYDAYAKISLMAMDAAGNPQLAPVVVIHDAKRPPSVVDVRVEFTRVEA